MADTVKVLRREPAGRRCTECNGSLSRSQTEEPTTLCFGAHGGVVGGGGHGPLGLDVFGAAQFGPSVNHDPSHDFNLARTHQDQANHRLACFLVGLERLLAGLFSFVKED